jgi:hypothetical protein
VSHLLLSPRTEREQRSLIVDLAKPLPSKHTTESQRPHRERLWEGVHHERSRTHPGHSKDLPLEKPTEWRPVEEQISSQAVDPTLGTVLGWSIQPDLRQEASPPQHTPKANQALLVDVDIEVGWDDRSGIARIGRASALYLSYKAHQRIGEAIVPCIGRCVDDEPPICTEDTARLSKRLIQLPGMEVLDEIKHQHPMEDAIWEREPFGIGAVDKRGSRPILMIKGKEANRHAHCGWREVDPIDAGPQGHTVVEDLAASAADIQDAHLRLDLGYLEGLLEPPGEQGSLAIDELGVPFTSTKEIGLIVAIR